MVGFDIIWIDLEHGVLSWREAENLCRVAQGSEVLPLMRVPGANREHVLHALDAGTDVVVVPMVNDPETARQIVEHGKYPPLGKRGFANSVRGLDYGVGDRLEVVRKANRETHLFVQIETIEALHGCEEIVAVEGITGGLVGPADLSFSMGKPLAFDDPELVSAYANAIRQIRAQNKIAATATSHPTLVAAALEAGVQIIICANEMGSLRLHWESILKEMRSKIS